jgi:hypothetical protein
MTAIRLMSLPMHGALEMATGLALMAAPFVVGAGFAGSVVAVLVGALLVGLALAAAAGPEEGRGTLPVTAHHAADHGLALGLFGGAAVVGASGDAPGALLLGTVALVVLALNMTTRYSRPG